MEFQIIKYKIFKDNEIIHRGECISSILDSITEMYLDFENNKHHIEIEYNGKIISVKAPTDHFTKPFADVLPDYKIK